MISTTDHAAQLRAAINDARAVFESEPAAGDALNYLHALIDTNAFFSSAAVPAQTGTAGSEVSLSKLFAAWERAGGERLAESGRIADEARRRATVETALAYIECAQDLRHVLGMPQSAATDQLSATGGANASIAEETLTGAGAAPVVVKKTSAADQAAAAMVAESAQLVADAERSVAARGAPLTLQQVDKVEDHMLALLAEPLTDTQREAMRIAMVAEFRALNAMGVQPAVGASSSLEF